MFTALEGPARLARYRQLFLVAAAYDIILGLAFTFLYDPILDLLDVVPPDNKSYIHLASVFVLVQGLGYLLVARDFLGNEGLVITGILYKTAYTSVAVYYLAIDELLHWVFFALGVVDLGFLVMFVIALRVLRAEQR